MDLLVHIAAPSSLHDDRLYRSQANAILHTFYQARSHEPDLPRLAPESFDSPVSVIPESPPFPASADPPASAEAKRRRELSPSSHSPHHHHHHHHHSEETTTTGENGNADLDSDSDSSADPRSLITPLSIHPPQPPISSNPFTTHITPSLSLLADRLKPARTFVPVWQTRELHVLERGCWVVNLRVHPDTDTAGDTAGGAWNATFFTRFWSFLSDFITEGRAGWGVWCVLGRDNTDTQPVESVLKVYTWGEVVPHIYLLLFLASERRIRKMGASWCDASERVVVQMP